MKAPVFALLLSFNFCFNLYPQSAETEKKLDSLITSWTKPGYPGGVMAAVRNGTVILKRAYGAADLGKKEPMTVDHAFDLASIAKQFTGMCIALLAEEGKLSVRDDIRKYYPHFQYENIITIQNLLSHTSGIRDGYVLAMLSGKTNLLGKVPKKRDEKKLIFEHNKRFYLQ